MSELKPCPFCGSKATVFPFISRIAEMPKPIKLFGRWSLIKMKYREIPCMFSVECDAECDGFIEDEFVVLAETKEEAIETWNRRADNG